MAANKNKKPSATSATKVSDADVACDGDKNSSGPDQLAEKLQSTLDDFLEFERNQEVIRKTQSEMTARLDELESLQNLAGSHAASEQRIRELQLAMMLYQEAQTDTERQIENLQSDLAIEQQNTRTLKQQVEELQKHAAAPTDPAISMDSIVASQRTADEKDSQPRDDDRSTPKDATEGSSDAWELQKIALMKKYDSNSESGKPLIQDSVDANQAASDLNQEPDDHFEIKGLNVSEIDEPALPMENISAVDDHQHQAVERDFSVADREILEQQKKNEIEQSLERARISRQRKALQEKIIAMQMESPDTSKKSTYRKKNLLSRMAQFLKRDEVEATSESRIDNLVKLVDSIHQQKVDKVNKYDDPRDQIFAENSHLASESNDSNDATDPGLKKNESSENGIDPDRCDIDESSPDPNSD